MTKSPIIDLRALPILWQVEAIAAIPNLRPTLELRAHVHAVSLAFRDHNEIFIRGFDLAPEVRSMRHDWTSFPDGPEGKAYLLSVTILETGEPATNASAEELAKEVLRLAAENERLRSQLTASIENRVADRHEGAQMYYIQKTSAVVGNCAVWWRPEGQGYCCDLKQAGRYTQEEAASIVRCKEGEHWAFSCDGIDALAASHVDVATLRSLKP